MQAGHSPRTVVASSNSVASIQCGNPVGSDTRFMTGERTCLMLSRPNHRQFQRRRWSMSLALVPFAGSRTLQRTISVERIARSLTGTHLCLGHQSAPGEQILCTTVAADRRKVYTACLSGRAAGGVGM